MIAPGFLLNIVSEVSSKMFFRMGYESGILKHHDFFRSTFFKPYWEILTSVLLFVKGPKLRFFVPSRPKEVDW